MTAPPISTCVVRCSDGYRERLSLARKPLETYVRGTEMKRLLIGITALAAASVALTTTAAPYEDYKIQIQRVQAAKLKGAARDRAVMVDHMPLMQEMNRQLEEARAVDQMTPEQMRTWITQHLRLMDQMHQQMMGGQPPMMGGTGTPARPGQ